MRKGFIIRIITIIILLTTCNWANPVSYASDDSKQDHLMPAVGSILVEAGHAKWKQASLDLEELQSLWNSVKAAETPSEGKSSELVANVDTALTEATTKLNDGGGEPAKQALTTLAKAVDAYVSSLQNDTQSVDPNKLTGPTSAQLLLPAAKNSLNAINEKDWSQAKQNYRQLIDEWSEVENTIRADNNVLYSQLETKITLVRVAIQAEPPRQEQANQEMQSLLTLLTDYAQGKTIESGSNSSNQTYSLEELLNILKEARQQTENGQSAEAVKQMEQFITIWPTVEGKVQISSSSTYTRIENETALVTGQLLSNPPKLTEAIQIMDNMIAELEPIVGEQTYTAWDAALILLREGLEAILVLAALLSYLKRSDNTKGRKWIWTGAVTGLVGSAILALILIYTISQAASGSARELFEGITGLVSVVMMLTIGHWLHSKSNTSAWNNYVGARVDSALARGSLWSLFSVSALAILREGAETTIFYVGMAPSIDPYQLLLGIGIALVILFILGYAIIALSVRLPLRAFFLTATVLIYYLVFRFLGESIHSLQIAGKLSAHAVEQLPSIAWLGMYPTWETFIPQIVALIFIGWQLVRQELIKRK
ncbi:FTR1 family iron permease [Paenibacillus glacialis]|uniref:Iron permease n=1 Tax=Paenibacillus glacialis TaxID=494026 RepID=A0A168DBW2_9BACL|nr:FTR1 family protein [Paenibacillus glacialis]OAB34062.1 iron permease [Paenibacillus glacialis]